jgi:hypothetical protein
VRREVWGRQVWQVKGILRSILSALAAFAAPFEGLDVAFELRGTGSCEGKGAFGSLRNGSGST